MTTAALIERTAKVYLTELPAQNELDALVSRTETLSATVPNVVAEITNSAGRTAGPADEMARMFFIVFDRAPDTVLFNGAMDALRAGATIEEICAIALSLTGASLNTSSDLSNSQFVDRLADAMWVVRPAGFSIQPFVDVLDNGSMTRAELLAGALAYDDPFVRYTNKVDTALLYLAIANRQATEEELELSANTPELPLIRQIVSQSAPELLGGSPYWTIAGPTVYVEGTYSDALTIDLSGQTALLGDSASFSLTLTRDGGFSESFIQFQSSLLSGVTRLDARGLVSANGPHTLIAPDTGATLYAGSVTTTLQGGDGNDTLVGNTADDILFGTGGTDTLTGGDGADTFQLNASSAYDGSELTTVTDFGEGADVLDLSRLIGTVGADPAEATVISGVSNPSAESRIDLSQLTRNAVAVVEHTGIWPSTDTETPETSTTLTPRTATQIANLFANVTFETAPERSAKYIVISTDPENGADIWLIENFTSLSTIEVAEVQKIGHLDSTGDIFSTLTQAGAIVA